MTDSESKDLVKQTNLPAKKQIVVRGMEGFDDDDLIRPILKINQPLSPMVMEGRAQAGTITNSLTEEVYGEEVIFQPVLAFKTRIYWAPRDSGGDILCRSNDCINGSKYGLCGVCAFAEWLEDKPPICTEIINMLSVIRSPEFDGEIVVVSFMKTSFKAGKYLVSKIKYAATGRCKDVWSKKYKLYIKQEKNDRGMFYILQTDSGVAVSSTEYKDGLAMYSSAINQEIKVDYSEPEEANDDISEADTFKEEPVPETSKQPPNPVPVINKPTPVILQKIPSPVRNEAVVTEIYDAAAADVAEIIDQFEL